MKLKLANLKIPKPKQLLVNFSKRWWSKEASSGQQPTQCLLESNAHKVSAEELARALNTSLSSGLGQLQAAQLLAVHGKNQIEHKAPNPILKLISYLFTGFCSLLWLAAIICILAWKPIGEPNSDPINLALAVLLILVVVLQAGFAAFQDFSSNRVMRSIRSLMPSEATVIRDATERRIGTEWLVPGDLLLLLYGTKVAADVRIVDACDLKFDKSLLTGESEAVEGSVECTDERYIESKNIAFMSTLITNGHGLGVVVATGKRTAIGQISSLTNLTAHKATSLQNELKRFVFIISSAALLMALLVVLVWVFWLRVKHPKYIDLSSFLVNTISVMIAFIPEGICAICALKIESLLF